jgi:hypothetical protein
MLDPILLTLILQRTRVLVAQGWCQGRYAETKDGVFVSIYSASACRWCLEGALSLSVSKYDRLDLLPHVHEYLCRLLPREITVLNIFNDLPDTTQTKVLALLDQAITNTEGIWQINFWQWT